MRSNTVAKQEIEQFVHKIKASSQKCYIEIYIEKRILQLHKIRLNKHTAASKDRSAAVEVSLLKKSLRSPRDV